MVNTIRKVLANGQDHLPAALFFQIQDQFVPGGQCYVPNCLDLSIDPPEKIENQNPEESLLYKAIKYLTKYINWKPSDTRFMARNWWIMITPKKNY